MPKKIPKKPKSPPANDNRNWTDEPPNNGWWMVGVVWMAFLAVLAFMGLRVPLT